MSTASTIVVIVVAVIFLGFFIKLLKNTHQAGVQTAARRRRVCDAVPCELLRLVSRDIAGNGWLNAIVSGVLGVPGVVCAAFSSMFSDM